MVHDNIVEQVEFIHNFLFLHPIFFDEMLEHLLRTKRNLHVMYMLDVSCSDISFGHMGSETSVFCKWIVVPSSNLKNIPDWWSLYQRIYSRGKRFRAREII